MSVTGLRETPAWRALQAHHAEVAGTHLRDLFEQDPERFRRFSIAGEGLLLDYAKNRVTEETMALLRALAEQADLAGWRARLFAGEAINVTEGRAALHVALRAPASAAIEVEGADIMPRIAITLERMRSFTEAFGRGERRGATGLPITDVVNIGIGGSDLGPLMVTEALHARTRPRPRLHFVSNVDPGHLGRALAGLEPESTLFIVASKSFTTQETRLNAEAARRWLQAGLKTQASCDAHFVAVTANPGRARDFGVSDCFEIWDWVGGRFSLWSAVGLPIALALGFEAFEELLAGARAMDEHFLNAPLDANQPLTLALLGLWYADFFGAQSQAVIPYSQALHRLPAYLQQAEMESNGKSVDRDGRPVGVPTAPVIWGEPGTNAQHAVFQLLHQGTPLVPVDFIVVAKDGAKGEADGDERQEALLANALAQSAALMQGRNEVEARAALEADGLDEEAIARLLPHKVFPGNRPSTTILLDNLTPHRLGQLIALYEHKIFCQGVLWGLNAFDQWGVELGKELAAEIQPDLSAEAREARHDSSTEGLLAQIKAFRARS